LPMCVSKHSSWMNPLALEPENALILRNFTISVFTTDFPSSGPPTLEQCLVCLQGRVPYAT